MKTKLFSIMAASAACALLLASCSEKEDPNKGGDEPDPEPPVAEDVYVSLLPVGTLETFELAHTQNGVSGEVSFSVKARLSGESAEDVTVTLKAECDGISSDKIQLSSQQLTVSAGRKESTGVTVSVSDWSELASNQNAAEYTLTVSIAEASDDIDENASSVSATINKAAYIESSFPDFSGDFLTLSTANDIVAGGYTENRTAADWTFEFWATNGGTIENTTGNTLCGDGTADLAIDNDLINFIVDFNEVKTLGGLYFQHWGSSFCPTKIRLSVSEDGDTWVPMGEIGTSSRNYIKFGEEVVTRYMKYEMLEATTRVDIMYMFIYEK